MNIVVRAIDTHSSAPTDVEAIILAGPTSSNLEPGLVPLGMPAAIPADQAYYWSTPWQRDLREAMEAYAQGDVEVFDSEDPNDVVRWLHEDEKARRLEGGLPA